MLLWASSGTDLVSCRVSLKIKSPEDQTDLQQAQPPSRSVRSDPVHGSRLLLPTTHGQESLWGDLYELPPSGESADAQAPVGEDPANVSTKADIFAFGRDRPAPESDPVPGLIQSPSQAHFAGLLPWGEVGGIAFSLCLKGNLPHLIST